VLPLIVLAVSSTSARAQDNQGKEIYQDFRNKQALQSEFTFRGANAEEVSKAEDEGLRISLPAERDNHFPFEVRSNFPLAGDFEVTGTYELLSMTKPKDGYGVGVSINIASNAKRDKFAKVCRMMRAKEGNVHLAEYWSNTPPKGYKSPWKPADTKSGQLRLTRKGTVLRCLFAEEPGKEFKEILVLDKFGSDDLEHVEFVVADSGKAGNPVEARLIDFRIRTGNLVADKGDAPAPLVAPAPAPVVVAPRTPNPAPVSGDRPSGRGWLVITLVAGLGITLLLALAVGVALFLRQRRQAAASPAAKKGKKS
jgi:hypothetical protein